jgi:hypothetical protein
MIGRHLRAHELMIVWGSSGVIAAEVEAALSARR